MQETIPDERLAISSDHDVVSGMGKMYASAKAWLERLAKSEDGATATIRKAGAARSTFYKVLGGKGTNAEDFMTWLENLGARLVLPDEQKDTTKDVCWVDAHVAPAGKGAQPPRAENYRAVPLVGEAGAGGGIIPQDEIKSWVLVYQHHQSVQFRRNLLAVEVGKDQTSMEPTLHPLDIVMVDRDDFRPDRPGGIFLVREPGQDGGGKIKRVSVLQKNGGTQIIFYSDNAALNPPESYILQHDYDGDIRRAIIGRVVWAWSDMTRK